MSIISWNVFCIWEYLPKVITSPGSTFEEWSDSWNYVSLALSRFFRPTVATHSGKEWVDLQKEVDL